MPLCASLDSQTGLVSYSRAVSWVRVGDSQFSLNLPSPTGGGEVSRRPTAPFIRAVHTIYVLKHVLRWLQAPCDPAQSAMKGRTPLLLLGLLLGLHAAAANKIADGELCAGALQTPGLCPCARRLNCQPPRCLAW
jgi:hypothetical protein